MKIFQKKAKSTSKFFLSFSFAILVGVGGFASYTHADTIQDFIASLATKELGLHIEDNAAVEGDLYVGEKVGIGTANPTEKLTVDGVIETSGGVKFADGSVQSKAGEIPAGSINIFAGYSAPSGWFIADGSAVSRVTYPNLWQIILCTYGCNANLTTFNLPNLKGRVPVGYNSADSSFNNIGKVGGEKEHLLSGNESGLPVHDHTIIQKQDQYEGYYSTYSRAAPVLSTDSSQSSSKAVSVWNVAPNHKTGNSSSSDASQAHNNLQPYVVLNYIIKY